MRLRTDFKYALIDEYYTYWDAFDNLPEFYSTLHACLLYTSDAADE